MKRITTSLLCLFALCAFGCTKYEYVIVDPPDLATTVAGKNESVLNTRSAEYRLRVVENVLVMFIYNRASSSVQLSGSKSVVIGPDGASHPIIGQTIAAGSFIKLILPPPRPQAQPDGPGFHYGVGYSTGRGGRHRSPYAGSGVGVDFYDPPSYTLYDSANPAYWDWHGETQVTLTLSYDHDGAETTDRFVIQRRKVQ